MLKRFAKRSIAAAVLAGFFTAACSLAGPNPLKRAVAESRRAMVSGDFQRAIDAYRAPFRRDPQRKGLAAAFTKTVEEGIYLVADRARGRQDFALDRRAYRVLLDNFLDFRGRGIASGLSFNKSELEAGLRDCRIALVEAEARQEMAAGNPAKALRLLSSAF